MAVGMLSQLPSLYALDLHVVSIAELSDELSPWLHDFACGRTVPTAVGARLGVLATTDMLPQSARLRYSLSADGADAVLVRVPLHVLLCSCDVLMYVRGCALHRRLIPIFGACVKRTLQRMCRCPMTRMRGQHQPVTMLVQALRQYQRRHHL